MLGFCLTELIVAMALSTFVALIASSSFMTIRRASLSQQQVAVLAIHQQAFYQSLNQSILDAGHMGCQHLRSGFTFLNPRDVIESLLGNYRQGIEIIEQADAPILWTKGVGQTFDIVNFDWQKAIVQVSGRPKWRKGDYLVVANCTHLMITRLVALSQNEDCATVKLDLLGNQVATKGLLLIGRLLSNQYDIKHGVLSLVQAGRPRQVLLEGIKDWQWQQQWHHGASLWSVEVTWQEEHFSWLRLKPSQYQWVERSWA